MNDSRYNPPPNQLKVALAPNPFGLIRAFFLWIKLLFGFSVEQVTKQLALLLNIKPAQLLLLNNGSSALLIALRLFASKNEYKKQVIMPTYVCPSLIEAIIAANLIPVLCDCDKNGNMELENYVPYLTSQTLSIIAPSLFGICSNIERIESYCKEHNIFLIDDAAQSMGSKLNQRSLGTFGDIGILSFNRHKPLFAFGGGVLIINNSGLQKGLRILAVELTQEKSSTKIFFMNIVSELKSRFYHNLSNRSGSYNCVKKALEDFQQSITPMLMSKLCQILLLDQIGKLQSYRENGTRNQYMYFNWIKESNLLSMREPKDIQQSNFALLEIKNSKRYAIAKTLSEKGIETSWLYYPLHLCQQYRNFAKGSYINAESLWPTRMCFPCRGWHSARSINTVLSTLNEIENKNEEINSYDAC